MNSATPPCNMTNLGCSNVELDEQLSDEQLAMVAGGAALEDLESHLADLESQMEKLNPQTEVGKALLKGLEALIKAAETKLEEEI